MNKNLTTIIDTMIKRRLCLPSNIDIDTFRKGQLNNISTCNCGNSSQHIACTFDSAKPCFEPPKLWDKYV